MIKEEKDRKREEIKNWRAPVRNRLWTAKNPYQGKYKKVLTCCSASVLRSPTAAWVLSNPPFNFNCRCAGLQDYAVTPADEVLFTWADEIVVMEQEHYFMARDLLVKWGLDKPLRCLNIPDEYEYRDPELVELIKERYNSFEV